MADRERVGRDASPSAAIIDSQSVKTTEAGGSRETEEKWNYYVGGGRVSRRMEGTSRERSNSPRTRICHWRYAEEAMTEPDSACAMVAW